MGAVFLAEIQSYILNINIRLVNIFLSLTYELNVIFKNIKSRFSALNNSLGTHDPGPFGWTILLFNFEMMNEDTLIIVGVGRF